MRFIEFLDNEVRRFKVLKIEISLWGRLKFLFNSTLEIPYYLLVNLGEK